MGRADLKIEQIFVLISFFFLKVLQLSLRRLPIQRRIMHWHRIPGLKVICRILANNKKMSRVVVNLAHDIPWVVVGANTSRYFKLSCCELPRCDNTSASLLKKFRYCSRCKVARYCRKEHQAEHWKVHKHDCKTRGIIEVD